ncbi:MAG TPA: hypothetical protein PLO50_12700 [Nitrospira sp.]|nr:hypothetical protein [Nitrospira sp.]
MPKDLPRHEFASGTIKKEVFKKEIEIPVPEAYVGEYDAMERSATNREKKAGKTTRNPEKRVARSATAIVAEALKSVDAAKTGLDKIYAGSKRELSGEAKESSTDLAGYFNDYKLSFDVLKNVSPNEARLFDWLEIAERRGGIGHWLEQWNAIMRDPAQRGDYSRIADIASSITLGIEFQKALIQEMARIESKPDGTLPGIEPVNKCDFPEDAELVKDLLDSVAGEISRQLSEGLNGRFETGSQLVAVRNAYKRINPREGFVERVRQASQNQCLAVELENSRQSAAVRMELQPVIDLLGEWDTAAASVSGLVQSIAEGNYPGAVVEKSYANALIDIQIRAAHGINEVVLQLFNKTSKLGSLSAFGREELLFQLSQTVNSLLEQHRLFAKELKDPKIKQKLIDQTTLLEGSVCAAIEKKRRDETLPRYYDQALAASENGSLPDLWRKVKVQVLEQLEKAGEGNAVARLNKLFDSGLGAQLDAWGKRQKCPEDIRGMAWQLMATIRQYKAGAEGISKVNEIASNVLGSLLDGIGGAVMQGLDQDIAAGLA